MLPTVASTMETQIVRLNQGSCNRRAVPHHFKQHLTALTSQDPLHARMTKTKLMHTCPGHRFSSSEWDSACTFSDTCRSTSATSQPVMRVALLAKVTWLLLQAATVGSTLAGHPGFYDALAPRSIRALAEICPHEAAACLNSGTAESRDCADFVDWLTGPDGQTTGYDTALPPDAVPLIACYQAPRNKLFRAAAADVKCDMCTMVVDGPCTSGCVQSGAAAATGWWELGVLSPLPSASCPQQLVPDTISPAGCDTCQTFGRCSSTSAPTLPASRHSRTPSGRRDGSVARWGTWCSLSSLGCVRVQRTTFCRLHAFP